MPTEIPPRTEADSVIAVTREATAMPAQIAIGETPLLLDRNGKTTSLERYLKQPLRARAMVRLSEPASFIAYVAAHAMGNTHLFGITTAKGGSFTAILDYHNTTVGSAEALRANWGEHVAQLTMLPTPEWERWFAANNKGMAQAEFAEFLEDNIADIIRPSGAELLEVALTLQAAKAVNFRSAVRLANGQHQIRYEETINAQAGTGGTLEIPERFTIRIAPFEGTEPVEIGARLRYRIADGKLVFAFRLDNPDRMVREQWQKIRDAIQTGTTTLVHRGDATITDPKA